MTSTTHDAIYRTGGGGVAWRQTGDEVVVLDLDGSVYFGLNTTGAALWQRLVTGATREQLIDELLRRGLNDHQRAGRDVDRFLHDLETSGLLRQASA